MMALNEAKEVFINRAFIPTDDGSGRIHDPEKWREACYVISKWLEQEHCEDAISRKEILKILPAFGFNGINDYLDAKNEIEKLPPVTPQPKTGHWISLKTEKPSYIKDGIAIESVKCSECDEWLTASDEYPCNGNYCPNCGAKMVEPQESEE